VLRCHVSYYPFKISANTLMKAVARCVRAYHSPPPPPPQQLCLLGCCCCCCRFDGNGPSRGCRPVSELLLLDSGNLNQTADLARCGPLRLSTVATVLQMSAIEWQISLGAVPHASHDIHQTSAFDRTGIRKPFFGQPFFFHHYYIINKKLLYDI
jgi:hypothetical protein